MSHKRYFETEDKDRLNPGSSLSRFQRYFLFSKCTLYCTQCWYSSQGPFPSHLMWKTGSAKWGFLVGEDHLTQGSLQTLAFNVLSGSPMYHILHCWYSSPGPPPSWSRHKWISPGCGVLRVYSKAAWRYFPRVVVESESIALKLNIWQCIGPTVYMGN